MPNYIIIGDTLREITFRRLAIRPGTASVCECLTSFSSLFTSSLIDAELWFMRSPENTPTKRAIMSLSRQIYTECAETPRKNATMNLTCGFRLLRSNSSSSLIYAVCTSYSISSCFLSKCSKYLVLFVSSWRLSSISQYRSNPRFIYFDFFFKAYFSMLYLIGIRIYKFFMTCLPILETFLSM